MTTKSTRTVLITGAGNGIGRTCALDLAQQGWNLILSDVAESALTSVAEAARTHGVSVTTVVIDLGDEVAVESGIERALAGVERLDAAVLAAGVSGPGYRSGEINSFATAPPLERFLHSTVDEWDEVMTINLRSTARIARAVAAAMIPHRNGSIVAISSVAGSNPMLSTTVSYSVSKAGVNALVKHLAGLLGPQGIRVNAVAPGVIETNMSSGFLADQDVRAQVESGLALQSIGQPSDVANAIKFLINGESNYITGETIFVDGGQFTG